jgi:serine/threonine-protein kinase
LTGQTPFDAEFYPDLVMKVATQQPAPPSTLRREVPPQLDAATLQCLEKQPEKRFQDVGQLAAAIAPYAPARAQGAVERIQRLLETGAPGRASLAGGAPGSVATPGQSRVEPAWARTAAASAQQRREIVKIFAMAVAGAAVVAIGAAALLAGRQVTPGPEEAQPGTESSGAVAVEPAQQPAGPDVTPAPESTPSAAQTMTTPAPTAQAAPPRATATASAGEKKGPPDRPATTAVQAAPPVPASAPAPAPANSNPLELRGGIK